MLLLLYYAFLHCTASGPWGHCYLVILKVCICVYLCVYVCIYLHRYAYVYACMYGVYVCIYMWHVFRCIGVSLWVHLEVCMEVWTCVCVWRVHMAVGVDVYVCQRGMCRCDVCRYMWYVGVYVYLCMCIRWMHVFVCMWGAGYMCAHACWGPW